MVYQARPNYVLRTISGEHLLVPVDGEDFTPGTLLMLNRTGCFLWETLQEPKTLPEIFTAAKGRFEDRDGTMEASITEFLELMAEKRLIEEREN